MLEISKQIRVKLLMLDARIKKSNILKVRVAKVLDFHVDFEHYI